MVRVMGVATDGMEGTVLEGMIAASRTTSAYQSQQEPQEPMESTKKEASDVKDKKRRKTA